MSTKAPNIWAHAIVAWFAIFITAALCFIFFAIRNPMSLVSQNYYEEELAYQTRIDNIERTQKLSGVSINYAPDQQRLTVSVPADHTSSDFSGFVQLYRPSNAGLDQKVKLTPNADGTQTIDTSDLGVGAGRRSLSMGSPV